MSYPVPPPSYGTSAQREDRNLTEPLIADSSRAPAGGGIYNQPAAGDLPDDFKVGALKLFVSVSLSDVAKYGVSVSESSLEIRNAFVRKVYSILCKHRNATLIQEADPFLQCVRLYVSSFYNLGYLPDSEVCRLRLVL